MNTLLVNIKTLVIISHGSQECTEERVCVLYNCMTNMNCDWFLVKHKGNQIFIIIRKHIEEK